MGIHDFLVEVGGGGALLALDKRIQRSINIEFEIIVKQQNFTLFYKNQAKYPGELNSSLEHNCLVGCSSIVKYPYSLMSLMLQKAICKQDVICSLKGLQLVLCTL